MKSYWWCPACNRGSDTNHRRCLSSHYNYNGMAWEAACIKAGMDRAQRHMIEVSEPSDAWLKKTHTYAILPAGSYYIGDVNSAVSGGLRQVLTEGSYVNGRRIYVGGKCAYQSRTFPGSNKHLYTVDSGYVGIVTVNLVEQGGCNTLDGTYHTFKDAVEVRFDDGVLHVASGGFDLKIDTRITETDG